MLTGLVGAGTDAPWLLVTNAVLAPPQPLPLHIGQPGVAVPVLLLAFNTTNGTCLVEIEGQRQLQCSIAVAAAPVDTATSSAGIASGSMMQDVLHMFGHEIKAAATSAAATLTPAALLEAQHKQLPMSAVAALAAGNTIEHAVAADMSGYVLHPGQLECCLQSSMLAEDATGASALWLSAVQSLVVPPPMASADLSRDNSWVAADFSHAADGSTCHIRSMSMSSSGGRSFSLCGAVLAADAIAAAEAAAAAIQPTLAGSSAAAQEAAAAAAASSAVAAISNPLIQLDEAERSLYLQAQIMSEVGGLFG